jgi:hypothetical protein
MSLLAEGSASVSPVDGSDRGHVEGLPFVRRRPAASPCDVSY